MSRRRTTLGVAVLIAGATVLAACGGADGGTGTASRVAATQPVEADAPAASIEAAPVETVAVADTAFAEPGVPVDGSFDICATIPSLDVINSVLTEPATRAIDLERGPGWDLCEAGTDGGIDNVQFSRSTTGTKEQTIALAAELGATVVELADPGLPGAFTYSGTVVIFIDGIEYSAQALTLDTIADPTSPASVDRSARLLQAWLANLGLA